MAKPSGRSRWLIVRTATMGPEERGILSAVVRRLREQGTEVVEVLLGTASYEAEDANGGEELEPLPRWVLEEDARGRGLRLPAKDGLRVVRSDELVDGIFSAERVVQWP